MANLTFDVNANDDASATFAAIAAQAEALKQQLDELDGRRVRVRIDVDAPPAARLAQLERLKTALNEIDGRTARARVDVVGMPTAAEVAALRRLARALREVDGINARATVGLTGDIPSATEIRRLASALRALDRVGTVRIDIELRGAAAALAEVLALQAALRGLRDTRIDIGTGGGGLGGDGAGGLGGMAPAIAAAIALAPALTAAGAAIVAVWGAVSTAIAAIPGALALAAVPIAAVMIGMDGIKKAAQTLQPEFDRLQKAVSAAFATGLTPVFDRLAAVFPVLQTGLVGTANALTTVAGKVTDLVTSGPGLAALQTIFANVNRSIVDMAPGITSVVDGLLKVAAQSGAFDAVSEAVNRFGAALDQSITGLIGNGTLDAAFSALGDLLGSLGEAFVSLVDNGIQAFVGAGPGLTAVVESITNLFNRFDWGALGQAAGEALRGVAAAIDSIPDSTIRNIEGAFKTLGQTLNSPEFAAGLRGIAAAVPGAINALSQLNQAFGQIAPLVGAAVSVFDDANTKFSGFVDGWGATADRWGQETGLATGGVHDALLAFDTQLDIWAGTTTATIKKAADGWAGAIIPAGKAIADAGLQIVNNLRTVLTGQLGGVLGQAFNTAAGQAAGAAAAAGAQVANTFGNSLNASMAGALGNVQATVASVFAALNIPVPPIVIDANPNPAIARIGEFVAAAAGAVATAVLNANAAPAQGVLAGLLGAVNGAVGTMTVNAVDGAARAVLAGAVAAVTAAIGTMTIDGNNAPAIGKTGAAKANADGTTGTMTVNANTGPALAAARAAAAAIAHMSTSIAVTITQTTVRRIVDMFGAGGVVAPMAHGGVLGATSTGHPVVAYAGGGDSGFGSYMGHRLTSMPARAAAVPPNTWRVVGDNPTATEVYIPLNGSKSSLSYTRYAANAQGYNLTPRGQAVVRTAVGVAGAGVDMSGVEQRLAAVQQLLARSLADGGGRGGDSYTINAATADEGAHATRMLMRANR